ncbi:MAG: protein translocase subunit SecF [Clostridiales bacterium]|jgi:preprotein translocase SecF subunit|nr:protein translocase subunit SecF [Clostridiales bacterium]
MKIIENRRKFFIGSLLVLLIGLAVILFNGFSGRGFFNLDVEFSGGLSMNVDLGQDFNNDDIAAIITEVTGQNAPQVQRVQNTNQVAIKILSVDAETRTALVTAISEKYAITADSFEIADISATVSGEMQKTAVYAILISFGLMLVYVSFRFKAITTGASAVITIIHDALFTVVCYGVLRIPLNNSFIAVILTIIGYAINNNIVVLDRIRENKKLIKRTDFGELVDKSINQSLRRCLFTIITTLLTITTLYILGVPTIKEFSLPIILGLICGTYSSICFTGSTLYCMTEKTI